MGTCVPAGTSKGFVFKIGPPKPSLNLQTFIVDAGSNAPGPLAENTWPPTIIA